MRMVFSACYFWEWQEHGSGKRAGTSRAWYGKKAGSLKIVFLLATYLNLVKVTQERYATGQRLKCFHKSNAIVFERKTNTYVSVLQL